MSTYPLNDRVQDFAHGLMDEGYTATEIAAHMQFVANYITLCFVMAEK